MWQGACFTVSSMNEPTNLSEVPVLLSATTQQADAMCVCELSTFIALNYARKKVPVKNSSFLVFWVSEGSGNIWIDDSKCAIIPHSMYCIYPHQAICFDVSAGMEGYALRFTPDFCALNGDLTRLLYAGILKLYGAMAIAVREEAREETVQLMQSMEKEYQGDSDFKTEMLQTLLKVFLIQLSRLAGNNVQEDADLQGDISLVNRFLEMVNVHFLTMKKVSDYAQKLSLAPNYLNIKVKRVSGYTAGYHIRQRIVLEAKRQAHWDRMSLKEISYKLGYNDVAHFSKFFKKEAGVSFSSFKRIQHAR